MASRTAIVCEGGAMRGIFAAGVLDVLQEHETAFDLALGCSAGACNLASFVAGQRDRNRRCYLTQMVRREFIDARRFARGGHWLDLDYLWAAFDREDPLDVNAVAASATQLVIAATNVATGAAAYWTPAAAAINEVLRASSAVPILYRKYVEIDGERYTDGGLSAPIPVEEAYRRGARKILVIRTRPERFGGPSRLECKLAAATLRREPGLAHAFSIYRDVYAKATAFIAKPPADCTIVHVAPAAPFKTTRTTRDRKTLLADYARGRVAGASALARWGRS